MAYTCERGNDASGLVRNRGFVDQLSYCQLLKEDSGL
jgi:hypothetical protein